MSVDNQYKWMRLKRKPLVTYSILAINVILFLLMELNGGSTDSFTLVQFGAKLNELIVSGQWWRLVTPMFLHIGFTHLLFNSLVVYFLGIQLEEIYGHFRFALIYLLSGLLGNVMSFAFNDAISAGASTAIFGMFISTLVLAQANPNNPAIQAIASNYRLLIIINIVFNLFDASVDLSGHIGGLIGGFLIASALTYSRDESVHIPYLLAYVGVAIIFTFIGYYRTLNGLL